MSKKSSLLVVALASLGLAAGGCGSSSSDNGSSSNNNATSTPSGGSSGGGSSTSGGSSGGSSGGGGASANPQIQAAVTACKNSINSAPQLTASDKSDLQKVCEKAANGDVDGVKKATREVCLKIVDRTAPAGPAKTQAEAACKQSTQ